MRNSAQPLNDERYSIAGISQRATPEYRYAMALLDVKQRRLANLRAIVERYDPQKAFAEAVGLSEAQLSQILKEHRGLGPTVARRIEKALGLDPNWLDNSQDGVPSFVGNMAQTLQSSNAVPVPDSDGDTPMERKHDQAMELLRAWDDLPGNLRQDFYDEIIKAAAPYRRKPSPPDTPGGNIHPFRERRKPG